MQARAIFEAALFVSREGITVLPEIMLSLVGSPQACPHIQIVIILLFLYVGGRTSVEMRTS